MTRQPIPPPTAPATVRDDAEFHRATARRLRRPGAWLAVDFGCGAGDMTTALADAAGPEPWTVVGVDENPERFAATAARRRPGVRFVTASFGDPVPDLLAAIGGPADLVWTRNALHHAADPAAAVARLARLLVPGGTLAVAEGGATLLAPDEDTAGPLDRLPTEPIDEESVALRGLLTDAGLTGVRTDPIRYARRYPADPADARHLLTEYRRRVDRAADRLSDEDKRHWRRLLAPTGPDSLTARGDLAYQVAATVHIGYR